MALSHSPATVMNGLVLCLSTDGTKSFVKWDGEPPEFVATLETLEGLYSYEEMLEILSTTEWTSPINN